MLDFSLQEMALTAVVALVVIGPKELPPLMRSLGRFVRRAQRVAGEFRQQFEDMADAAELEEIKRKARLDADAVEPILSGSEAAELSAPLIVKEETHTTPDKALTLIVAREDDDITLRFDGCPWCAEGNDLVEEYAIAGQSLGSPVMAARQIVGDLKQGRAFIVIDRNEDGTVADARITLIVPEKPLPPRREVRLWSGKALPHD